MQLAQQDDLPTFARDSGLQRFHRRVAQELLLEPPPAYPTTDEKRHRRASNVTHQHNQKTPPQAEEKPSADAEQSPWK